MVRWKSTKPTIKHTGPEPAVKPCHLQGLHVHNQTKERKGDEKETEPKTKEARAGQARKQEPKETDDNKSHEDTVTVEISIQRDLQHLYEERGKRKISSDSIHHVKS